MARNFTVDLIFLPPNIEHYTSMLDSNQIKYSGETIHNHIKYSGETPPVAINYLVSLDTLYIVLDSEIGCGILLN
jgi:hypothetical protein